MGNACFGKQSQRNNKGVVHQAETMVDGARDQGVTIKVRMTRGQLSELIGKVDMSNSNSELGRLIVQECSNGSLVHARIVVGNDDMSNYKFSREQGLKPIQEHEEE